MKNIYIGIALIISIAGIFYFLRTPTYTNHPPQNETIVAFGDSLVEGKGSTSGNDFVSLLSKKINKPILNLGISGNTTQDGLARLDRVTDTQPGTVLLLLGGNDYLQKVEKKKTFKNLEQIIQTLQSKGIFVILLGIRGGILTDSFDGDFANLADKMHIPYVPNVLSGLYGNQQYMSDAVHPNDRGYTKIADTLYEKIGKYLESK